jgi:phosphoglycerate dehydrogenase-like enzyme
LHALGSDGVLVNIARGTLVDTSAVATALKEKRIWAAALDVYEFEPTPPSALLEFDNAILTPHVGGISPQAIHASVVRFIENSEAYLTGKPLLTQVN